MRKRPGLPRLVAVIALTLVVLVPALASGTATPAAAATQLYTVEETTIAQGTPFETPLYIIHGAAPGPVAMVVAGANGAQPAGVAAAKIASEYRISNGTLLVLPEANKQAVDANTPWVSGGINLQTAFPRSRTAVPRGELATSVWDTVKQYGVEYLVDLHESPTYYVPGSSSLGQTVSYQTNAAGMALATATINALNASAAHAFKMLPNSPLGGLPRAAADYLGVVSLTVRGTASEPLEERTNLEVQAVNAMLTVAGIQYNRVSTATLAAGTDYATPLYVFDSMVPGPTVMIVGGVHGNEPAGYGAALQYKDEALIATGRLLVLPEANTLGDRRLSRYVEGKTDLNRLFPTVSGRAPSHPLALAIWNAVKDNDVDYLVDLHEGYDYVSNPNNSAVGQTFIYYPSSEMQALVSRIVATLNAGISNPYKRFVALKYPVPGSLARAAGQFLGVKAGILETVYPEPYALRTGYHITAIDTMLKTLGMK